jgi:hypothetical protein
MVVSLYRDIPKQTRSLLVLFDVCKTHTLPHSLPQLLSPAHNLKLHHIPMPPLPLMPMRREALALWRRNPGKHAHLHNHHIWIDFRNAHNRTSEPVSPAPSYKSNTLILTSHTRHKSTAPHTSRYSSHSRGTSSSRPAGPARRPKTQRWLGSTTRRTLRLCGSWRSGIGGRAGAKITLCR